LLRQQQLLAGTTKNQTALLTPSNKEQSEGFAQGHAP
jgi:hypothetical protein